MLLGETNNAICFKTIKKKYLPGNDSLYVRESTSLPFIDYIPNPNELGHDLHQKVEAVNSTSLKIISTQRADEYLETPKKPLVSVIVPTYMDEEYITGTLESIAGQDYKDFEILIVNDGSNDHTVDLILAFMTKHTKSIAIKFVKIPHIGHPGISRNIGLYNLLSENTEFIAFMDGDDLYANSTALSILVDAIQDSHIFAAYGDYDMISNEGTKIARPRNLKKVRFNHWAWKDNCKLTWQNLAKFNLDPYHLQCILVRKGCSFIPYSSKGEDAEFYARLFKKSANLFDGKLDGIVQVPSVIAHYRKRLNSICNPTTPSSDNNTNATESHDSRIEKIEQKYIRKSIAIPPFYEKAGIPDQYITPENISHWATKRWLRMLFRALFRGNLKDALINLKLLIKDKRIRKRELIWLPFKQLFTDPAISEMGIVLIRRIWSRKN